MGEGGPQQVRLDRGGQQRPGPFEDGGDDQGGGLEARGVAIVPAYLLRSALGFERVLSDAEVARLAATGRTSLGPAA
jgi:hypothetical protein